jgi:hypothetical protein
MKKCYQKFFENNKIKFYLYAETPNHRQKLLFELDGNLEEAKEKLANYADSCEQEGYNFFIRMFNGWELLYLGNNTWEKI